jgi:hypothetical protein
VTADFQAAMVSQTQRPCDDTHLKFALRFEGTLTSSDARLAGDLVVQARSVADSQTGYGTTTAHVAIRDHATGAPKFDGTYLGVLEPGGDNEGVLVGRTIGKHSARLVANANIDQDPNTGAITGELGKDSQTAPPQDSAVLTDACDDASDG